MSWCPETRCKDNCSPHTRTVAFIKNVLENEFFETFSMHPNKRSRISVFLCILDRLRLNGSSYRHKKSEVCIQEKSIKIHTWRRGVSLYGTTLPSLKSKYQCPRRMMYARWTQFAYHDQVSDISHL